MNDNYGHDELSGILTDICGVIVKTIGLIPTFWLKSAERMVNGDNATEH